MRRSFSSTLLAWYDRNRRDLPWRALPGEPIDPYAVWLSEIMLQQTTVETVKPYFAAFLVRWPDVAALAGSSLDEVMRAWAGLGYYARGRNLHACARRIVSERGGRFPETERELAELPGIGPYTAAAIAAIAFDQPCAAIDGNVERVVSRLFAISTPKRLARREILTKTQSFLPRDRPGDFAQALMDFGALVCTPRSPSCCACPLASVCEAALRGAPEDFPIKPKKTSKPKRRGAVFVLRCGDEALLRTRAPRGLLGGMTEFPATPFEEDFDLRQARVHAPLQTQWRALEGKVEHVFTHFSLELTIFIGIVEPPPPAIENCRWASAHGLREEALPSLMRKVAVQSGFLTG